MGYDFLEADESNPNGHWEDIDFHNINKRFLERRISALEWAEGIRFIASNRREPWGFKDVRTAELVSMYADVIDGLYLRCRRPINDIVASAVKWHGMTKEDAREMVERREANLDTLETIDVQFEDIVSGEAKSQIKDMLRSYYTVKAV